MWLLIMNLKTKTLSKVQAGSIVSDTGTELGAKLAGDLLNLQLILMLKMFCQALVANSSIDRLVWLLESLLTWKCLHFIVYVYLIVWTPTTDWPPENNSLKKLFSTTLSDNSLRWFSPSKDFKGVMPRNDASVARPETNSWYTPLFAFVTTEYWLLGHQKCQQAAASTVKATVAR